MFIRLQAVKWTVFSRFAFSVHPFQLPPDLLKNCAKLHTLSVRGNQIDLDHIEQVRALQPQVTSMLVHWKCIIVPVIPLLQFFRQKTHVLVESQQSLNCHLFVLFQMEGFAEYEARRKQKVDKRIAANVMLHDRTLDVGADRAK